MAVVGADAVQVDAPLAALTTFRVGGPADVLVEPRGASQLQATIAAARALGAPVTLLGGGSNVLISDAGVRGIVVRPRGGEIADAGEGRVRADAAVSMNGLVRWCLVHGCAGLEAWAGTPGTVGGAVCGNAHFGGVCISDRIIEARVLSSVGAVADWPADAMGFGYDRSRLQGSGEVLLSAVFAVSAGDPQRLRDTARASLAFRKRTQPLQLASAGCVFMNPDAAVTRLPAGVPYSAGALIDRVGLKGAVCGGAQVSTVHANFIVNTGRATARDIARLVERCREAVQRVFGVTLAEEIVRLGEWESDVHSGH